MSVEQVTRYAARVLSAAGDWAVMQTVRVDGDDAYLETT